MITVENLFGVIAQLREEDLQRWIANAWVRPHGQPGQYLFEEIDVARIRLIVELRYEFRVDEEALPIVLSLLDQLHDTRREMQRVLELISEVVPEQARREIHARLGATARRLPLTPG
jgi:chaperone modulatory protein CbpM